MEKKKYLLYRGWKAMMDRCYKKNLRNINIMEIKE